MNVPVENWAGRCFSLMNLGRLFRQGMGWKRCYMAPSNKSQRAIQHLPSSLSGTHALGGQPACYEEGQVHEDVTCECPSRQPPALAPSIRGCRKHRAETRHTPVPRPNSNPQKPWAIINEYWNLKPLVFRVILLCSCRYFLHSLSSSP